MSICVLRRCCCILVLTVGSSSFFGRRRTVGRHLTVRMSGASDCRELLFVWGRLTVGRTSLSGAIHEFRYFCHTSRQWQNCREPLIVVRSSLSGVSHCQEVSLLRASCHCELLSLSGLRVSHCFGRRRTAGKHLTVRSFSLSGASQFLGASCCWEASHCRELLIVRRFSRLAISATRVVVGRIVGSLSLS